MVAFENNKLSSRLELVFNCLDFSETINIKKKEKYFGQEKFKHNILDITSCSLSPERKLSGQLFYRDTR